ncbi:hypothetical protein M2399_001593 [Pseudomonas sp. BIGb0450]|jgi:hypothetical protein|uniref:hypothetical protein n=1 Tax=unclassified Pseudomonas TaxID=196821 RepID=UPI0017D4C1FF|nr:MULTISPECIES: hypothetical protein [unclassified Pseudomonas]MCS3417899.1 hypothetical protein [Pseudomonas sp. BIGb0558]MCS3436166.1 hypothetical protein [Pseudomonas sp. BIGb0450]NVZ82818.1 hypothetical protein [Pseudomonas yamanorum]
MEINVDRQFGNIEHLVPDTDWIPVNRFIGYVGYSGRHLYFTYRDFLNPVLNPSKTDPFIGMRVSFLPTGGSPGSPSGYVAAEISPVLAQ